MKAAEVFIAILLSVCIIIGCVTLLFSSDKISALNMKYRNVERVVITGLGEVNSITCYTVSSIGFVAADKDAIGAELASKYEKFDWITYQYYFDESGKKPSELKNLHIPSTGTYPRALGDTETWCELQFTAFEIVKTYPITVEVKKDVYTITYYTIPFSTLAQDIIAYENANIEKHVVTVPKDRVSLIEHGVSG